jgi:UDP-N-acetylmuramoyl-tripeptide--D-alanyl-D-alanine ligase
MSALWPAHDLVKATGGTVDGDWCAWRVEIDSRKVQPGDLFVAVKGERVDGHEYVQQAFAAGAIGAVVEKKLAIGGNQLVVENSFAALDAMAKYNRARSKAKIIGVTGSVGKTSTKEMLRLALSVHGKTYATSGNYNNHIGTPLNLANLPLDAEYGVFEMGMNHAGEILHLTKMVRPNIALISNVEAVHMEFFASIDEIAKAKGEIFEGLENGGVAIINADQRYFENLRSSAITFGADAKADCRLLSYKPTISGCEVSANIKGEKIDYIIAATGRHWALISLSVLAAVHALGLDAAKSAAALANFSEVEGRGRVVEIATKNGAALLINDSYNASPASMCAAFAKTNEVWQAQGKKGRKIALLGDMLELGEQSPKIHAGLAADLQAQGFDKIYSAGKLMQNLHDALPADMRGAHAPDAASLGAIVSDVFAANDVILIKGSHGSKMYALANDLIEKGRFKDAV